MKFVRDLMKQWRRWGLDFAVLTLVLFTGMAIGSGVENTSALQGQKDWFVRHYCHQVWIRDHPRGMRRKDRWPD